MTPDTFDDWLAEVERLPEPDRSRMLDWAWQQMARRESLKKYPTPADLAQSIDDTYVITPAIRCLSDALERALRTRRARLLITMPPQEGKSELVAVWTVLRALQQNPERRVILASFSADLAEQASSRARNIISSHGTNAVDPLTRLPVPDRLGIGLASDKAAAAHWRLAGHRGGMVAVGLGGTITGRPADVLIIDDPLKGMQDADSATERRKVISGYQGDLTTRLAPGAPIILIQTRWHEEDLAGYILETEKHLPPEQRRWEHINIPAQAERGVPDALGRAPGEFLTSTRGRTKEDWEETRRVVGERVWYALYQGVPTPVGGGLFQNDWFDRYRDMAVRGSVAARLVSIDPAETGRGDEAGIIALEITADGRAWVTQDRSGLMQSDQWARTAVLLTLETQSGELLFEAFTSGPTYERVIRDAWLRIRKEAKLLDAHDGDLSAAASEYATHDDAPADPAAALSQVEDVPVPDQVDPPFRIQPWRASGDKVARATGTRQAASTGRLRMVGKHLDLERQATQWQPGHNTRGQSSPDRVDALVNGFERGMQLIGRESQIAVPTSGVPAWGARKPASGNFWKKPIG